ncbi:MAG: hypothetical protein HY517_02370, partial [Candidatus Aenigmarchaeota archaeon]|nr:hypothetical protein [Candidatus Aenigmarchaeota archaeon]
SDRFSFFTGNSAARGIDFTLETDRFADIDFKAAEPVDFVVTGYTEASLKTGNLKTNKTVGIIGFRGTGGIAGSTLWLDGRMSKVELPEITVSVQETVKANATFASLSAKNLAVKELKIPATTGTLTVRGSSTQFSGDIAVVSPEGDFEFAGGLKLAGKAASISIPSAGISIK